MKSTLATPPLLRAQTLVKSYHRQRVVDRVSLEVREGEIVGLLGPNGAGKTTTFRMIVGMIPADEGRVFFQGAEITRLAMYRRARRGLGYLSQEPSVFRRMTVADNIMAVLEAIGEPRQTRARNMESLLAELDLTPLRDHVADTLSGGERRRLEITRSLATNPRLILLDEPFSGVDPIAVQDIQTILKSLAKRGIGILITDHNVHEILNVTQRSYIIYRGQVLKEGTPAELKASEEVRRVYLGDSFAQPGVDDGGLAEGLGGEEKDALDR
ncbi:MAG: LPS export ABC transporter ATP-binding protein [Planctomycetota bacterium]